MELRRRAAGPASAVCIRRQTRRVLVPRHHATDDPNRAAGPLQREHLVVRPDRPTPRREVFVDCGPVDDVHVEAIESRRHAYEANCLKITSMRVPTSPFLTLRRSNVEWLIVYSHKRNTLDDEKSVDTASIRTPAHPEEIERRSRTSFEEHHVLDCRAEPVPER